MDSRPMKLSAAPDAYPFLSGPQKSDEIGRLGPYRVLMELGRGGMGIVFLADEPTLKRRVALKVMLPEIATDPRAVVRFRREAEAQAQVEHEHIIAIYRVGQANGVTFIAMPLLKGQTLGSALKISPRPPVAELVRIGREIAEGLAAAHAVGLIHRDIKPANIWLEGAKRRVKILDFGLARTSDVPTALPASGFAPAPTTASGFLGTPAYMSPEQASSRPTDSRTDLFSLGSVLYQMAVGKMPFTGPTPFDVVSAVVAQELPPLQEVVPDVPPPLSALIQRLTAKAPADRPKSAEEVAGELAAIEHELAPRPGTPIPSAIPDALPVEADPWVGIDTVNPDAVTVVQGERADPPSRAVPNPKWLKPAVALVAVLALALAVVAVMALRPKSEPAREPNKGAERAPDKAPGPVKVPAPKDKPLATSDRPAAEALRAYADLTVRLTGENEIVIKRGERLPTEPFVVTGVELVGGEFPPDFVDRVFLPAAERLAALNVVAGWGGSNPELTEAQIARFAALPTSGSLTELKIAPGPQLAPGTIDALKKFPNLRSVSLNAAGAPDDVLKRLAELKLTDFLGLTYLGGADGATGAGLAAVAVLPVRRWTLANSVGAGKVLGALPETAKYEEINLWYSPVADDDLRGLVRCQGVGRLVLRGTKVTDAGLEHLRAVRGLGSVDLTNTGVTAEGVEKLKQALPGCRVEWTADTPKK